MQWVRIAIRAPYLLTVANAAQYGKVQVRSMVYGFHQHKDVALMRIMRSWLGSSCPAELSGA